MRLSLLALLTACAANTTDGSTTAELSRCDREPDPGVEVQAAEITGDTLTLTLGFGGGCSEHAFALCWDGAVAKSLPTQVTLVPDHVRGANDRCEAALSSAFAFDVSLLRTQDDGTLRTDEEILVHIGEQTVSYVF
jgi:hypothetical protein